MDAIDRKILTLIQSHPELSVLELSSPGEACRIHRAGAASNDSRPTASFASGRCYSILWLWD